MNEPQNLILAIKEFTVWFGRQIGKIVRSRNNLGSQWKIISGQSYFNCLINDISNCPQYSKQENNISKNLPPADFGTLGFLFVWLFNKWLSVCVPGRLSGAGKPIVNKIDAGLAQIKLII